MVVYVTHMFRWGEESHSYILGIWDDLALAEKETKEHVQDRDGKYDGVIFEFELNTVKFKRAICTYRGIGFFDRINGLEKKEVDVTSIKSLKKHGIDVSKGYMKLMDAEKLVKNAGYDIISKIRNMLSK